MWRATPSVMQRRWRGTVTLPRRWMPEAIWSRSQRYPKPAHRNEVWPWTTSTTRSTEPGGTNVLQRTRVRRITPCRNSSQTRRGCPMSSGSTSPASAISRFNGKISWVQIDLAEDAEDADHYIDPDERFRIAMARQ